MKRLFLLLVPMLACIACKHQNNPISPTEADDLSTSQVITHNPLRAPMAVSAMAYSSPAELNAVYAADPQHVIYYNVARYLATTELLAGANIALGVNPNNSWHLTQFPKIVYNYDNTPKYYEFGYVEGGQIVATVTTYAKKEIAGVIAFLFSEPLSYDCPMLDYYVGNYPNRYYGTGGECYLASCDKELEEKIREHGSTDEEELKLMLEQMGEKDRAAIEEDLKEEGGNIEDDIKERDDYWKQMDEFFEKYLDQWLKDKEPQILDDKELDINLDEFKDDKDRDPNTEQGIISQLADMQDYMLGYYDTKILKEYNDQNLQETHWEGYCGPSACAWIYRGKYDSYNGTYLPIHGDGSNFANFFYDLSTFAYYKYSDVAHGSNLNCHTALYNYTSRSNSADNGLTACWYNETVPFIWSQWEFPLYHGGIKRGFQTATNGVYSIKLTSKPYDYMWNNNEPLIIEIDCNHYIAAFGSGVTKKKNGNIKDVYFLVTDNGNTIAASSYHPYMRKKSFWNLHYGLKK